MNRDMMATGLRDRLLSLGWVPILFVLVCSYLPIVVLLAEGFRGGCADLLREAATIVTDARRATLGLRSLAIAAGTVLGSLLLGTPYALLLTRTDVAARSLLRGLALMPLLIPSYVFAIGWKGALGPGGLLSLGSGGGVLSGAGASANILACQVAVLLSFKLFPLVVFILAAGHASTEADLEEAGMLAHRRWWVIRHVTLPLLRPHIAMASLLVFNLALADYTVPSILQLHTYPVEIFAAFSGLLDRQAAIALSLPMVLVGSISVILARVIVGRRPIFPIAPLRRTPSVLWQLGVGRIPLAVISALLAILLVSGPVLSVIRQLGSVGDILAAYRVAGPQIWTTALMAMVAASLLTIVALLAAVQVSRATTWKSILTDLYYLLPVAVPATVLGIGLIRTWNHPDLGWVVNGVAILILAYCGRLVSFAVAPVAASLATVPREIEDAGRMSGMSAAIRTWRLHRPLSRSGLAVAWLLCFCLCLDEVGASILVLPPGIETLAVRIYNLTHYDDTEIVAGLCCIIVLLIAGASLFAWLVSRSRPRSAD